MNRATFDIEVTDTFGGGVSTPLYTGYISRRELHQRISDFLDGIYTARGEK